MLFKKSRMVWLGKGSFGGNELLCTLGKGYVGFGSVGFGRECWMCKSTGWEGMIWEECRAGLSLVLLLWPSFSQSWPRFYAGLALTLAVKVGWTNLGLDIRCGSGIKVVNRMRTELFSHPFHFFNVKKEFGSGGMISWWIGLGERRRALCSWAVALIICELVWDWLVWWWLLLRWWRDRRQKACTKTSYLMQCVQFIFMIWYEVLVASSQNSLFI